MSTATNRDRVTFALLSRPKTAVELSDELSMPIGSVHGVLYAGRNGFTRGRKLPSGAYVWSVTDTPKVLTPAAADVDPAEIVTRDRQIQTLKDELAEHKSLYKAALRDDALARRVASDAVAAVKAMPPVDNKPYRAREKTTKSEQSVVALNSCLHYGEVVEKDATMGLSEYNPALAAARWQYFVESTVDLVVNHHRGENIRKLYVINVGDNTSGDIHLELKATNKFPIGAQMVRCAHLLAAGLRDLAPNFEEIEFVGTVGNHGRFEKKPHFKEKFNNADWVVYQMMAALLADQPNIKVTIPRSPWATMNIQGHDFFFTHGDNIKSYFQFPWYDSKRFTTEMAQLLVKGGEPYPEYWGFGHFHQMNIAQLSYGEWLFTGSFKGPDEYSIGKLRAGTPPSQLFFGVHPRRGVSFRYPITMTEASLDIQDRYLRFADPDWEPEG